RTRAKPLGAVQDSDRLAKGHPRIRPRPRTARRGHDGALPVEGPPRRRDADVVEGRLREAQTWALVDPLAGDLIGPLSEADDGVEPVLERWAQDEDFWLRRSVLLAHLVPLRQGRGDFDRFSRFADAMLEEKEFFIRKAIGWVLRDTSRKRPDLAFDWILPRAHRASGVTIREAVNRLAPEQRDAVMAAR